jgi:hypothetical protein
MIFGMRLRFYRMIKRVMVIRSRRNIKAGFAALILFVTLLLCAPAAFGEEPNDIDINEPGTFLFTGDVVSRSFQIGNKGIGILNYTLIITGPNASNFGIDGNSLELKGEVNNIYDVNAKNTHTIDVNYGLSSPDTILNAELKITNDNNNFDFFEISLMAQAPEEPNEPNEPNEPSDSHGPDTSTVIGKSAGRINLSGNVLSKKFKIWNKGTEILNYTLTIDGNDAYYFSLDTEEGQLEKQYDEQIHTVGVEYDSDFHNDTLYAWIEIADENDDTSYIDLSATETVATRVSRIAIEQGVNYGHLGETYDFHLYIETDNTVEEVDFITPEDAECMMEYDENEDGSIRYWLYLDEFDSIDGLADYGDGTYVITVTYDNDNNDTAQTKINFGIPNKPGTIVWPTQEPIITYPEEDTVSPVRLKWEKCTDPNAGSVRLVLENYEGEDDEEILNSIGKEYSKGTTKSSKIKLDVGYWRAILGFGKWYQSKNDDGIPYVVGKCTKGYSYFEIMKWFGTFDEFKNHPLKIADCCGTEVTFNITGGGWGWIKDEDSGFTDIDISGTTEKSVFSIKTKRNAKITVGDIYIDDLETDGDIKAIKAKNVNLEGDITIDGGARSITLNNVTGSIDIGIRDSEDEKIFPCFLKLNRIAYLDLTSETPIKKLRATEWLAGSLDAPWISAMTIKGDFGAELDLSGDESPKGMTLKKAKIAGAIGNDWTIDGDCGSITFASSADADYEITGNIGSIKAVGNRKASLPAVLSGDWKFDSVKKIQADNISQCDINTCGSIDENVLDIGSLAVKEWLSDCTITTNGNIASLKAGGMQDCNVSAQEGPIGKLEIRGIKNEAFGIINSNIFAQHIDTAYLGYPKYNNGGVDFGLTINSIDKLTLKDSSHKTTWLDPNLSTDPIIIDDFKVTPPYSAFQN